MNLKSEQQELSWKDAIRMGSAPASGAVGCALAARIGRRNLQTV